MKSFMNKTAYITGGSSGIGLSAALELSKAGANVIIFARQKPRLKEAILAVQAVQSVVGQKFSWYRMDVADPSAVKKTIAKAVKEFGPPDLLINCAGRALPGEFEEITAARLDETMKINLYGIWHTVSAILPHIKKNGGHIVNVSSVTGFLGIYGYTDYSASKFAVLGLSEAMRSEFRKYKISVSVLCPPDTDTPGFATENLTKPEATRVLSGNAKLMSPESVARALIKGIRKNRKMIIAGADTKFIYYAKRFAPWLVDFIINRQVDRVTARQVR